MSAALSIARFLGGFPLLFWAFVGLLIVAGYEEVRAWRRR